MLKQRVITAAILLPLAILGFFWLDGVAFALFTGSVIVLGGWEWARLAGFSAQWVRTGYAGLIALLLAGLYQIPALGIPLLWLAAGWWLLAIVLVVRYPEGRDCWHSGGRIFLMGLPVLLPAWQALQLLKQWPMGNELILLVMVLVWTADIGAFFAGRALGRHKLAPGVSPGKSWEGVAGGLLGCLLVMLAVGACQGWSVSEMLLALCGTVVVVMVSVVGDLTESMFKRNAGLKDSSQLLPGHGGILDRIDSLTAAVPVFALLLWLTGWGN